MITSLRRRQTPSVYPECINSGSTVTVEQWLEEGKCGIKFAVHRYTWHAPRWPRSQFLVSVSFTTFTQFRFLCVQRVLADRGFIRSIIYFALKKICSCVLSSFCGKNYTIEQCLWLMNQLFLKYIHSYIYTLDLLPNDTLRIYISFLLVAKAILFSEQCEDSGQNYALWWEV